MNPMVREVINLLLMSWLLLEVLFLLEINYLIKTVTRRISVSSSNHSNNHNGTLYMIKPLRNCKIVFITFQIYRCEYFFKQIIFFSPTPHYRVDADKGFNYSNSDEAFVCQKKNHFQVTCHVQLRGDAQFVKTQEGFKKITRFHVHFYGVKVET